MKEPEAEWKQELRGRILILRAEAPEEPYGAKMLRYNHLPSMPEVHVGWIDGKEEFRYDVSGLVTVADYLKDGQLTGELIRRWMLSLLDLYRTGEGYLLEEEDFLCLPSYLFLTPQLDLRVCYLEGYGEPVAGQLKELTGAFLEKVKYEEEADVQLVYDLYQCCIDHCSETRLREVLERPAREKAEPAEEEEGGPAEEAPEAKPVLSPKVQFARKSDVLIFCGGAAAAALLLFFGGQFFTESGELRWVRATAFLLLCAAAAAVVFREELRGWFRRKREEENFDWGWAEDPPDMSATQPLPRLLQETAAGAEEEEPGSPRLLLEAEDGEVTQVPDFPCIVGSLYASDLVLPVRTVSRRHAVFSEEDGRIFLADLGSLNGTRVNGHLLQEGARTECREGDEVRFADVRRIVHLRAAGRALRGREAGMKTG